MDQVHHVFLPTTGRSLCDRAALTRASGGGEAPDVPACSACLLLISYLRRRGAATLKLTRGVFAPERPSEAWESLRPTGWGAALDLDEFAQRADEVDRTARVAAFMDVLDAGSVDRVIGEWRQGK